MVLVCHLVSTVGKDRTTWKSRDRGLQDFPLQGGRQQLAALVSCPHVRLGVSWGYCPTIIMLWGSLDSMGLCHSCPLQDHFRPIAPLHSLSQAGLMSFLYIHLFLLRPSLGALPS